MKLAEFQSNVKNTRTIRPEVNFEPYEFDTNSNKQDYIQEANAALKIIC